MAGKKRKRLDADHRSNNDTLRVRATPGSSSTSRSPPPHLGTTINHKQGRRHRRTVRFSPSTSNEIITVPRWTPAEDCAAWYTTLDINVFKIQEGLDASILRYLLHHAMIVDSSLYRGLERRLSPWITNEIRERRRHTVWSVLAEQALQRKKGVEVLDTRKIAEVSLCCSHKAAIWAWNLGGLM